MRLSNKVFPCISIFICFRVKYYNLLSAGDIKHPWRVGQLKLWGGRPWSRQTVCLDTSCISTNFRLIQLVLQETQLSEWDKCISMLREHVFISINCWKVDIKTLMRSTCQVKVRYLWEWHGPDGRGREWGFQTVWKFVSFLPHICSRK